MRPNSPDRRGTHRRAGNGTWAARARSQPKITMTIDEQRAAPLSDALTVVLYDGICGLCNRLVSFLLRHDHQDQFRFAPLQSAFGKGMLRRHGLNPDDLDTVVVVANFCQPAERALTRSEAVLWAAARLPGAWKLLQGLKILPLPMREAIYRFIAGRRYRIFGRYEGCPPPKPGDRHKFLEGGI